MSFAQALKTLLHFDERAVHEYSGDLQGQGMMPVDIEELINADDVRYSHVRRAWQETLPRSTGEYLFAQVEAVRVSQKSKVDTSLRGRVTSFFTSTSRLPFKGTSNSQAVIKRHDSSSTSTSIPTTLTTDSSSLRRRKRI